MFPTTWQLEVRLIAPDDEEIPLVGQAPPPPGGGGVLEVLVQLWMASRQLKKQERIRNRLVKLLADMKYG
jgi:hypothetical protein